MNFHEVKLFDEFFFEKRNKVYMHMYLIYMCVFKNTLKHNTYKNKQTHPHSNKTMEMERKFINKEEKNSMI